MDRSSSRTNWLQAELTATKAQNVRLEEENVLLRHRLNRFSSDQSSSAAVNVEAKIKAFQMEEERDNLCESLQHHKKKYNKLHDAYLDKVKRCKALEEMFRRQKTLSGLVMKSAIEQRNSEQKLMQEKRQSAQQERSEVEQLQAKLSKLQAALDESYDIIDEMDFELESVDLLEMENKNLRDELTELKRKMAKGNNSADDDDDAPPKYDPGDFHKYRRNVTSSTCESYQHNDDNDAETLERAALTESLVQTAEAESNCLRRELLRSRLQHAVRAKLDKEEALDEEP